MKLIIPSIGDKLILTKDWSFKIMNEYRNERFWTMLTSKPMPDYFGGYHNNYATNTKYLNVVLPKGTELNVQRVYIRNGSPDYDSLTFTATYKGKKPRFWVNLVDVHNIEFNETKFMKERILNKIGKINETQ